MKTKEIQHRIKLLQEHLNLALTSPTKKFDEINSLKKQGIYIIFQNEKIIYVGKTGRNGKTRLRELISDYRSHTLNKKLLQTFFELKLERPLSTFNKNTKNNLILQSVLTLEQFIEGQKNINNFIRNELGFKFYEIEDQELISLEHFAIAIFDPIYND